MTCQPLCLTVRRDEVDAAVQHAIGLDASMLRTGKGRHLSFERNLSVYYLVNASDDMLLAFVVEKNRRIVITGSSYHLIR